MKLKLPSVRLTYLLLCIASIIIVALAVYLQETYQLDPCPLCDIQRIIFLLAGLVCLIAAIHNPKSLGQKIYAILFIIVALLGLGVAGRQMWIQYMPHSPSTTCGGSLTYLLRTLPLSETLKIVFRGSGECETIGPRYLFLSITEWSCLFFFLFAVIGVFQVTRSRKKR